MLGSEWRRETLRTNLWFVPAIEVAAAVALFVATHAVDQAAYRGDIVLPSWVISGTADAARQILTALAAAVITVVGVVFSIMIVTLTLASTQFGPRMLRNFIRDRGAQLTLGTFVGTFVYAMLTLVSIRPGSHGDFIPHLSITLTLALTVIDMGVLIYFIHHIATSIQLPQVIAAIARDLSKAIARERADELEDANGGVAKGPSVSELNRRMAEAGGVVSAPSSGYLQFVRHDTLVRIATETGAVIRLHHRPGHFVVRGHPVASVWPAEAADDVERGLRSTHVAGPSRTLSQDVAFAVDQLVEIAIRALSPAVNDTFTALTCIDWLGESLCRVPAGWRPSRVHRDAQGYIRVITVHISYGRLVQRAFDKIRQAGRAMPAVMIRQLEALTRVMEHATNDQQRHVLLQQGEMIRRAAAESVPEAEDRADVERAHQRLLTAAGVRPALRTGSVRQPPAAKAPRGT
jgi:uncharacterized membrane protein